MTIISLLLVLLVERVTTKSQYWQFEFYFNKLVKAFKKEDLEESSKNYWWLGSIILPVFVVYILVQQLAGGLIELVASTAILSVFYRRPIEAILRPVAFMQNNSVTQTKGSNHLAVTWFGKTTYIMPPSSCGLRP
jgi:membrane protein required for beta-lactamase induction